MRFFHTWVTLAAQRLLDAEDVLTDLDRAVGDGDHGTNMARAARCLLELPQVGDDTAYLKSVAMTIISKVGGTAGPLYGTLFLRMSAAVQGRGEAPVNAFIVAEALSAGVTGVVERGKAQLGDKTMVDVLQPVATSLWQRVQLNSGCDAQCCVVERGLSKVLAPAVRQAEELRDATAPLVARKGRASYLGERSRGTVDPGAASAAIFVGAAAEAARLCGL